MGVLKEVRSSAEVLIQLGIRERGEVDLPELSDPIPQLRPPLLVPPRQQLAVAVTSHCLHAALEAPRQEILVDDGYHAEVHPASDLPNLQRLNEEAELLKHGPESCVDRRHLERAAQRRERLGGMARLPFPIAWWRRHLDWWKRGNRPSLEQLELATGDGPFDVLRTAKV